MPKFKNISEVSKNEPDSTGFLDWSKMLENQRIAKNYHFFDALTSPVTKDEMEEMQGQLVDAYDNIINTIRNDVYESDYEAPQELLNDFFETTEMAQPTAEEKNNRENDAHAFRVAFAVANAKESLLTRAFNAPMDSDDESYVPTLHRSARALLVADFSKKGIEKNREIRRIITGGTPEEQRKVYTDRINEIVNEIKSVDFESIDFSNTAHLTKLIDEHPLFVTSSADFVNILRDAEATGCNFLSESGKEICAYLKFGSEIGMYVRSISNLIGSPSYSQLPLEKFSDAFSNEKFMTDTIYTKNVNVNGENKVQLLRFDDFENEMEDPDAQLANSMEDIFSRVQAGRTVDRLWENSLGNFTTFLHTKENILFNHDVPAKDRQKQFFDTFAATTKDEFSPHIQRELKNSDGTVTINKEAVTHETEEIIKEIQKFVPEFDLTKEEKDALLSQERINNHLKAEQLLTDEVHLSGCASRDDIPDLFTLISKNIVPKGNDTASVDARKAFADTVSGAGSDAHQNRKDLIFTAFNEINNLKGSDFRPQLSDGQFIQNCFDNFDKLRLANDIDKIVARLPGCNIELGEVLADRIKTNRDVIKDISKAGLDTINMYADGLFLSFPVEKITPELSEKLKTSSDSRIISLLKTANSVRESRAVLLGERANGFLVNDDDAKFLGEIDEDDFVSSRDEKSYIINSCEDVKRFITDVYNRFDKADHFYNLRNSKQYKDLRDSLKNASKILDAAAGGGMSKQEQQSLYNALRDLNDKTVAYSTYKNNDAAISDLGRTRLAIANEVSGYLTHIVSNLQKRGNEQAVEKDRTRDLKFSRFVKEDALYENKILEAARGDDTEPEQEAEVSQDVLSQEKVFEASCRKNEDERELLEKMNVGAYSSTSLNAQLVLCEAREALTDRIGRKEFEGSSKEQVLTLMAAVICCKGLIANGNQPADLQPQAIMQLSQQVKNSPTFKNITDNTKIDSEFINSFLGDRGAEKMFKSYTKELKKNLPSVSEPVNHDVIENPDNVIDTSNALL